MMAAPRAQRRTIKNLNFTRIFHSIEDEFLDPKTWEDFLQEHRGAVPYRIGTTFGTTSEHSR